MPKLCEAWATGCLGFCGWEENRAGRTELMPRFTEACVESGSGQKTDVQGLGRKAVDPSYQYSPKFRIILIEHQY